MKKFLVGLAAVFVAVGAQAQGFVNFNNIGSAITWAGSGDAVGAGYDITITLDGADSPLFSTPIVGGGTFLGGSVDLGPVVDGGVNFSVDIVGEFEGQPVAFSDGPVRFEGFVAGDSTASPPAVPAALGFPAGVTAVVVPEPSTIALGILGLGALALRRRRNA